MGGQASPRERYRLARGGRARGLWSFLTAWWALQRPLNGRDTRSTGCSVPRIPRRPREDPDPHGDEPHHRHEQVGRGQHHHLDEPAMRRVRPAAQQRERADVTARPAPKTSSPCTWWRTALGAPAHAEGEPPVGRGVGDRGQQQRGDVGPARASAWRSSRKRTAYASVLATPTPGRCAVCGDQAAPGVGAGRGRAARRPRQRRRCPVSRAQPRRRMPRRSSSAVRTMSTLLSGSSTQSTGTSWIRRPARSASTSSSVSKNQVLSSTSGSSSRATSLRIALKPHWASLNLAPQRAAQDQVVAARDELPLRPALDPRAAASAGTRSRGRSAR